ncbi:MAG: hypothetical protein IJ374_05165 [Lachnospiraceae bacterium]|nr:hypothetical protein [Lachnospiraceae bacterium]
MEEAEKERFEYTYSAEKQKEVERIRKKYLPEEEDKMETLRKLDRSAEKPGQAIAIVMGTLGSLIFGIGMCCVMLWAETLFVPGIVIGLIGMLIVSLAYPMYIRVTKKQRAKIADRVLELSKEICV